MSLRAPAFLYQRGTIRTAQNSLLEEKVALCDQPGAGGLYLPLLQLLFFQLVACRVVKFCLVQESNGTGCRCPCVCWWELPLSIEASQVAKQPTHTGSWGMKAQKSCFPKLRELPWSPAHRGQTWSSNGFYCSTRPTALLESDQNERKVRFYVSKQVIFRIEYQMKLKA